MYAGGAQEIIFLAVHGGFHLLCYSQFKKKGAGGQRTATLDVLWLSEQRNRQVYFRGCLIVYAIWVKVVNSFYVTRTQADIQS